MQHTNNEWEIGDIVFTWDSTTGKIQKSQIEKITREKHRETIYVAGRYIGNISGLFQSLCGCKEGSKKEIQRLYDEEVEMANKEHARLLQHFKKVKKFREDSLNEPVETH